MARFASPLLALPLLLPLGPACSRRQGMEKYVSPRAAFLLYKPVGWTVTEQGGPQAQSLRVSDPTGQFEAALAYGRLAGLPSALPLAGQLVATLRGTHPDFRVERAEASPKGERLRFEATFTKAGARRELRAWVALQGSDYVCSSLEAPAGRLGERRRELLTILANVRIMRGSEPPPSVPMTVHRLADGSASFRMPSHWRCQDVGRGQFLAGDPGGAYGFMAGSVDVVTPRLGVRPPGVLVSPALPPGQAWRFVTASLGLAEDMTFLQVIPRPDLASPMAAVYTAGPVQAEEVLYRCRAKGRALKGYTLALTFGSRLDTTWNLRHLSVVAPEEAFDAYLGTFAEMLASYRIDDAWAQQYVAQGLQRLRQLQQQTSALVARNAQEIRGMMQAAYDERQRSMDYIDYQRTSYIRGTQDWVSASEGGTLHQSDRWGTRNLATGESWEGHPYDYVNFDGRNPRTGEAMQAIDSRALYERHLR